MGGAEKLAKRKAEGVLNARERIDYLSTRAASSSPAATRAATGPR